LRDVDGRNVLRERRYEDKKQQKGCERPPEASWRRHKEMRAHETSGRWKRGSGALEEDGRGA
jgi:hypothetical protein